MRKTTNKRKRARVAGCKVGSAKEFLGLLARRAA